MKPNPTKTEDDLSTDEEIPSEHQGVAVLPEFTSQHQPDSIGGTIFLLDDDSGLLAMAEACLKSVIDTHNEKTYGERIHLKIESLKINQENIQNIKYFEERIADPNSNVVAVLTDYDMLDKFSGAEVIKLIQKKGDLMLSWVHTANPEGNKQKLEAQNIKNVVVLKKPIAFPILKEFIKAAVNFSADKIKKPDSSIKSIKAIDTIDDIEDTAILSDAFKATYTKIKSGDDDNVTVHTQIKSI